MKKESNNPIKQVVIRDSGNDASTTLGNPSLPVFIAPPTPTIKKEK